MGPRAKPLVGARAVLALGVGCACGAATAQDPTYGPPWRDSTLTPLVAAALIPLLSDWIAESRDAAVAQGVHAVPGEVRAALAGYVPDHILEKARWSVGGAGELSLQENLFRFDYAPAVTLDYVVIFANASDTVDPKLWAHELRHVMQFAEWGVPEFAARYLRDYEAVERDAAEYRWEWMKLAGLVPRVNAARPLPTKTD